MRILFTFAGGSGHLEPLLPIAAAARRARHEVAFVGRPLMAPRVAERGFPAFAAGTDRGFATGRLPLAVVDVEREMRDLAMGFGRRIARERAADLLPLCAAWRPDLLVCEEVDYGAMLAAERLGLPFACVLVLAEGRFVRPRLVAAALDEVRAEYGLPPDPELLLPSKHLVLSPFPARFRHPAAPWPATAHPIRLMSPLQPDASPASAWTPYLSDAPTVYVTLGTIFNRESGDLFERVLAGMGELPINVVVTVGRDLDPAELGTQPPNVHVAQFLPLAELLARCDAVVAHGGSGTLLGCLTHGLPSVLIPMGADQPLNAARSAELGIALVLDAHAATPDDVRAAVLRVLNDPTYRQSAASFRDEIAAMPDLAQAVALLEQLVVAPGASLSP